MLRGLLCCVSEDMEGEPSVAYTRQDDRYDRMFMSFIKFLSLFKFNAEMLKKIILLPRQEELRREEVPEIVMRRSVCH